VLLVEDDSTVRLTTRRLLERAGFRVEVAHDGEEAWRRLQDAEVVDIVMTDLLMPRLSGGDLVRRVRGRHPQLPVLIVSAHPDRDWVGIEARDPCTALLHKPFPPAQLAERLRALLATRRAPRAG
jgi:DNA-binding response OmpR family regulator